MCGNSLQTIMQNVIVHQVLATVYFICIPAELYLIRCLQTSSSADLNLLIAVSLLDVQHIWHSAISPAGERALC